VLFGLNLDYFLWQITEVDSKREDYFQDGKDDEADEE
jgi:hypothetical protein